MKRSQEIERPDDNRPVETLRDGRLKASIWRNEGERGAFFSTTFSRAYKDQDGEYRDTQSFGQDDLLRLSELASEAHRTTNALSREAFKDRRSDEERTQKRSRGSGHGRH